MKNAIKKLIKQIKPQKKTLKKTKVKQVFFKHTSLRGTPQKAQFFETLQVVTGYARAT